MVLYNQKIGKEKGITIIELGKGDVQVGTVSNKEEKYAGVNFVNDEVREIGTKHNTVGTTTDNSGSNAVLIFKDIKSIEVVEKHLKNAKIILRNL